MSEVFQWLRKGERATTDNTVGITDLHPEILSHIFAFLPLVDRKNVKLVCRSWYECCACANITKREKFVFRAYSSIGHATKFMQQSSYSIMNLEFQDLPINYIPASTWEECGKRIQKLELRECQWTEETIRNIVLHCENLMSFVVRTRHSDPRQRLYSQCLLDYFIKKGIRRPKLHTLSIGSVVDGINEVENILRKVFLLHPCIENFDIKTGSYSFFSLEQCSNPEMRLQGSLTYNILRVGEWMKLLADEAKQGLRLKHLEGELKYEKSMQNTVFNFFKSQRNLEVLRLSIPVHDNGKENLVLHILESCPKLKELSFYSSSVYFEPLEMPQFVNSISKLNFLSLRFRVKNSDCVLPLYYNDLLCNTAQLNLTSLQWENMCCNQHFCAAFLQRCSSLQHLYFKPECCDTTLQVIFQYLLKLQTLVLGGLYKCTAFGFTGRNANGNEDGYSIKRLQHLKYLELHDSRGNMKDLALELPPRLEFLHILSVELLKQLSKEELNLFASNLPELRVLSTNVHQKDDCLKYTIKFCKRLKNLDRLILISDDVFAPKREKLNEIIFKSCHRLRYIIWDICEVYFRDPFTKRVFYQGSTRLKFPGNIFTDKEIIEKGWTFPRVITYNASVRQT